MKPSLGEAPEQPGTSNEAFDSVKPTVCASSTGVPSRVPACTIFWAGRNSESELSGFSTL
jgi:hypothetical protein